MPPVYVMTMRRVFVVWSNPLFRDSALVLLQHPDVHCVGVVETNEIETRKILSVNPDTILVEEAEGKVPGEVMELLESQNFGGRLVTFSLGDNRLRAFHREEWTIVHADDLLHLILQ